MKIWGHHAPSRSLLVLALTLAIAAPASADGESIGFFEARRLEGQAEAALKSGKADQASEIYQRLAEGSAKGKRQARAFYGHALAELSRGADAWDSTAVRSSLESLISGYPGHENAASAKAMIGLMAEMEKAPATPAPPPPTEPAPAAEPPEESKNKDSTRALESRVRQLEATLAETREELAQKEEALRKLRELVVEGGGG